MGYTSSLRSFSNLQVAEIATVHTSGREDEVLYSTLTVKRILKNFREVLLKPEKVPGPR